MTSSRNENGILDAARECVLAVGMRRTTLTEVARRAGVSRPTVYRHWPDMRSLAADLLTRELRSLLPGDDATGGDARVRGVDRIVSTVAAVREHPLLRKILETDPELLVTYTFDRLGTSQREILEVFAAAIRDGQRDGSITEGDPEELAAMLLLVTQSAVLSARVVAERLPAERLDEQLRAMLENYLRPEPPK
ncbi:TetR/AcrR family transcriptional regulator [Actinopolyspora erythraea]|uniref:TetR family transcriptional regulator n=1 Tax=Actinopolyspora erythraea TaxID=414996 RepID=A0A099D924_9ACTN|nr:TetR/AcrR family transcriptional regulator [Actinopolyspora erythraea]ASU79964.1 TetR/AcrR family transcriptional regulator [Actinopolyspora erythraea]KGI82312.1 TetR family transcriptional regulator [Actinopolyspora erythraea]